MTLNDNSVTLVVPVTADQPEAARPRILVISDSGGFVGPDRAYPTADPRLWPNLMGHALGADVDVVAGYGWTSRNVWFGLGHDPLWWSLLAKADAVVFATQFDGAPSPLPNCLWNTLPRIRRRLVRRYARAVHMRAVRHLTRVTTRLPGGGLVAIRPSSTLRYLRESLELVHRARPRIPVVGVSPIAVKACLPYAGVPHAGWRGAARVVRQWSVETGVPLLDLQELVSDHLASDRCNPDGMHFGWEGHELVSEAAAQLVGELLGRPRSNGAAGPGVSRLRRQSC